MLPSLKPSRPRPSVVRLADDQRLPWSSEGRLLVPPTAGARRRSRPFVPHRARPSLSNESRDRLARLRPRELKENEEMILRGGKEGEHGNVKGIWLAAPTHKLAASKFCRLGPEASKEDTRSIILKRLSEHRLSMTAQQLQHSSHLMDACPEEDCGDDGACNRGGDLDNGGGVDDGARGRDDGGGRVADDVETKRKEREKILESTRQMMAAMRESRIRRQAKQL